MAQNRFYALTIEILTVSQFKKKSRQIDPCFIAINAWSAWVAVCAMSPGADTVPYFPAYNMYLPPAKKAAARWKRRSCFFGRASLAAVGAACAHCMPTATITVPFPLAETCAMEDATDSAGKCGSCCCCLQSLLPSSPFPTAAACVSLRKYHADLYFQGPYLIQECYMQENTAKLRYFHTSTKTQHASVVLANPDVHSGLHGFHAALSSLIW